MLLEFVVPKAPSGGFILNNPKADLETVTTGFVLWQYGSSTTRVDACLIKPALGDYTDIPDGFE